MNTYMIHIYHYGAAAIDRRRRRQQSMDNNSYIGREKEKDVRIRF